MGTGGGGGEGEEDGCHLPTPIKLLFEEHLPFTKRAEFCSKDVQKLLKKCAQNLDPLPTSGFSAPFSRLFALFC